jgi:signal recognition particle receptor subunit beta
MGGCLDPEKLPTQTADNTVKILCLGVGGCGKTTFVKALKIINEVPWKEAEIQQFIKAIRTNYVKGIQDAIDGCKKLGWALKPENIEYAKEISLLRGSGAEMNVQNANSLKELWNDPAIQRLVEKHSELLSVTHLVYFWDNFERITQPNFVPNHEDILRARVRTAGANASTIFIDKCYYEFFDVGGQRPERSKWEFVFRENRFNAIIYFVASDEYDVDNEDGDNDRTKLEISRYIFAELVNSDIIDPEIPVVLFLNRSDLFQSRILNTEGFQSFKKIFPDYKEGQDITKAMNYLRDFFLSVSENQQPIKTYVTCALDRNSLVVVWHTVRKSIMDKTINEILPFNDD